MLAKVKYVQLARRQEFDGASAQGDDQRSAGGYQNKDRKESNGQPRSLILMSLPRECVEGVTAGHGRVTGQQV